MWVAQRRCPMSDEYTISFDMWSRQMYFANRTERNQYKLKPYPSFEDYFNKNKDFLKLKYEEFKQ